MEINKVKNDKKYFKKFVNDNSEKISEKVKCLICGGSYDYFNKNNHLKTKKHKKILEKENDKVFMMDLMKNLNEDDKKEYITIINKYI